MIIDELDKLKAWLVKIVKPLCDADPNTLTKYVIALIKKDKSIDELRLICVDQLQVFLNNETHAFVELLFKVLEEKLYLEPNDKIDNGTPSEIMAKITAPPVKVKQEPEEKKSPRKRHISPPPSTSQEVAKQESDSQKTVDSERKDSESSADPGSSQPSASQRTRSRSRSRSRSPKRRGADAKRRVLRRDGLGKTRVPTPEPLPKRAERETRRSPAPRRRKSLSRSRSRSRSPRARPDRRRSRTPPRHRSRSPANIRTRIDYPFNLDLLQNQQQRRERCKDYDLKGVCNRGDMCQFDHGNNPIIVESDNINNLSLLASRPTLLPTPPVGEAEEYNPEAPQIDRHILRRPPPASQIQIPPFPPHGPPPHHGPFDPSFMPPNNMSMPPIHGMPFPPGRPRELLGVNTEYDHFGYNGRGRGGRGRGGRGRGGRGGFNQNRNNQPPTEEDKTSLIVRKIPPTDNSIMNLIGYFSKFGTVTGSVVNFEGDSESALVTFASHGQAMAAFKSPDAVLGNRFIRLYWKSRDLQEANNNNNANNSSQESQERKIEFIIHPMGESIKSEPQDGEPQSKQQKLSIKDRLGTRAKNDSEGDAEQGEFGGDDQQDQQEIKQEQDSPKEPPKPSAPPCMNPMLLKKVKPIENPLETKERKKKEQVAHLAQVNKKRTFLLKTLIEKSKEIIEKMKANPTPEEQDKLRQTLTSYRVKIDENKELINKTAAQINELTKVKTVDDMKQELLDAEIDLHSKLQQGEATKEMRQRVELLRLEARKKFKLVSQQNHDGTFVVEPIRARKRSFPGSGSRSGRGRGGHFGAGGGQGGHSATPLKVDKRTKKIFIPEMTPEEHNDLVTYLTDFGLVEMIEFVDEGAIVSFKNRTDAENAMREMKVVQFKERNLEGFTWYTQAGGDSTTTATQQGYSGQGDQQIKQEQDLDGLKENFGLEQQADQSGGDMSGLHQSLSLEDEVDELSFIHDPDVEEHQRSLTMPQESA